VKITEKIRTRESYFEGIQVKSKSFIKSSKISINSIDSFLNQRYETNLEDLIAEMLDVDDEKRIDTICDICQSWVNWLSQKGKSPKTVSDYFVFLKLYLHFRKIKITPQDVKESIHFPAKIKEEKYPLTNSQILEILDTAQYSKKGLYLALLSSGMRIGELVQITKKDIVTDLQRLMIRIPARITKTKQGRTTFISKEAAKFISRKLREIGDDDLVWGKNSDKDSSMHAEEKTFREYLKKIGFHEKYDSGRLKISPHSFRAFFFTKAARRHDENYAHMMTGHGGYLMQYDRLTDEEKLDMYLELEPDLLIFDQTKNEEKIRKLKEANIQLADQAEQLKQQEVRIKQLERSWLESKHPGIKNL